MKKSLLISSALAMAFLVATTASSLADDKKVTVSGEGKCAKCSLKETESCQNAITAEEKGKKVTYYLEGDVSKGFHKHLCQGSKQVKATGTVKEVNGKKVMAVTEIKLAEK